MGQKSIMDIHSKFLKRKIEKSKQTYHNEWILFQESLSNSLDTIYKSKRKDGEIEIILNLNEDSVIITDNGKGFPHNPELLLYGGSDKDPTDEESWKYGGSQGVGLKVVYFNTEDFHLTSVIDNQQWTAHIKDGYKYLTSEINLHFDDAPKKVKNENGTQIRYKFPVADKPGRVHAFLNDLFYDYYETIDSAIFSPKNWLELALLNYFKSKTYAEDIRTLLEINDIEICNITVKIIFDLNTYKFIKELPEELIDALKFYDKIIGISFQNKYWDIKEAVGYTKTGVGRPTLIDEDIQPSGRGNKHNTSYIWYQKLSQPSDYIKLLQTDHPLREPVDIEKYKTNLFPSLTGIYIIIGSTDEERLPRYLFGPAQRFISAKGVPTEHAIQNPAGVGELGYVPYIHFVADLSEELNEGKRTISNTRLVGHVNDFFKDAYRVTLRNIVTRITGRVKREMRKKIKKAIPTRDIVDRVNISLDELSIKKVPEDEETVIALFYELIGREYLNGYQTYANFRIGQYDGNGVIIPTTESGGHTIERDSDLDIFEFKNSLSEIIENFENGDKDPMDIDLIICWTDDITPLENPNYQMIYIDHSHFADSPYHRVTKCLRINEVPIDIQVLVLSEVLEAIRQEKSKKSK